MKKMLYICLMMVLIVCLAGCKSEKAIPAQQTVAMQVLSK